jgi:hypothetical protein
VQFEYRISCDRETVTFTRISDHKKMIETKCKGKDLDKKADETIALTNIDRTGVRYLDKLKLRGSTVEHTFN